MHQHWLVHESFDGPFQHLCYQLSGTAFWPWLWCQIERIWAETSIMWLNKSCRKSSRVSFSSSNNPSEVSSVTMVSPMTWRIQLRTTYDSRLSGAFPAPAETYVLCRLAVGHVYAEPLDQIDAMPTSSYNNITPLAIGARDASQCSKICRICTANESGWF